MPIKEIAAKLILFDPVTDLAKELDRDPLNPKAFDEWCKNQGLHYSKYDAQVRCYLGVNLYWLGRTNRVIKDVLLTKLYGEKAIGWIEPEAYELACSLIEEAEHHPSIHDAMQKIKENTMQRPYDDTHEFLENLKKLEHCWKNQAVDQLIFLTNEVERLMPNIDWHKHRSERIKAKALLKLVAELPEIVKYKELRRLH